MNPKLSECPDCKHEVSVRAICCPNCGGPLWHKTIKDAYGSRSGLGLFDLIPGIRDLPYVVRIVLMAITVVLVCLHVIRPLFSN